MNKYINIKRFLTIAIIISVIIWALLLWITQTIPYFDWDTLKHLPTVLTIDMFLFGLFVTWIWKWPLLQGWLVPFPDLNGEWTGKIESLWVNPETKEKTETIDVTLFIKQTYLTISCIIKSNESESTSYSSSFLIDLDTGEKKLTYCYFNKPKPGVRERSALHYGTAFLNILKKDDKIRLEGEYWTSRKTAGELYFEKKEIKN